MKKFLLSLALLASGAAMSAQEVTFDFASANVSPNAEAEGKVVVTGTAAGSNIQPLAKAAYQGVTITFAENGASTKPAWYANTGDIRLYAKSGLTVTAPEGKVIESIAFTFTSGWGSTNYNGLDLSSGTLSPDYNADNKPANGASVTWTKSSAVSEVTLTLPAAKTFNSANPQFRFVKAVVTLSNGSGDPVAPVAPTITGPATFYSSTASISISAAAGASVYYTMQYNGTPADPTTSSLLYDGEIVINNTATIKAIAVKDGLASEVATATFTKGDAEEVSNIAEFLAKASGTVCTFKNPVTVMGIYSKRYLFVQDNSGALQIFDGSSNLDFPYQMGQTISGFTVKLGAYNGTPQGDAAGFASSFPTTASGTATKMDALAIESTEEAVKANLNRYVALSGTITKTGNYYYMGSVQLYDRFSLKLIADDVVDTQHDVTGFAVMFNTTPELFYTQLLAYGTEGVDSFDHDVEPIYGAEGYIVAPEGAQIFNVSGQRVANSNLRGIYLVRYNGVTTKVFVK